VYIGNEAQKASVPGRLDNKSGPKLDDPALTREIMRLFRAGVRGQTLHWEQAPTGTPCAGTGAVLSGPGDRPLSVRDSPPPTYPAGTGAALFGPGDRHLLRRSDSGLLRRRDPGRLFRAECGDIPPDCVKTQKSK
jgi:hypothetical protein